MVTDARHALRDAADVSRAGQHERAAVVVVSPHAVEREARLVPAVVEVRRAVAVERRLHVERMRNQEAAPLVLEPIADPLHLRIGEVLSVRAERLAPVKSAVAVVNMRHGRGVLRHLSAVDLDVPLFAHVGIDLTADDIDAWHGDVLQQLHHVSAGKGEVVVRAAMLEEMSA